MKYLGIDYGTKRVGLAMSDVGGTLAFPFGVIQNDKNLMNEIKDVIAKQNIGEVVIGQSMDLNGAENKLQAKIEKFKEELGNVADFPVHYEKEYFTSHHATTMEGKEGLNDRKVKKGEQKDLDASAAALILQRFLDKVAK